MKQAHKLLIVFSFLMLLLVATLTGHAQATHSYQGKTYTVQIGPKGGKYIMLSDGTKHYIAQDLQVVVSGNNAIYNGQTFPLLDGPKGGKYFVYKGTRKYVPKKKP